MRYQFTIIMIVFSFYYQNILGQTPNSSTAKQPTIEVYLVNQDRIDKNDQCRYCFLPSTDDLAETAFIKDSEIIGIDITNNQQSILLSDACLKRLKQLEKASGHLSRAPFALVVDGKPIYGGWFLSTFVSNNHACDWIHVFSPFNRDGNNRLEVKLNTPKNGEQDPRNNKLLLDYLMDSNRLITD